MQLTLDQLPPDMTSSQHSSTTSSATASSASDNSKKKATKGGGLFGRFKKIKEPTVLHDEAKDLNLQRAIALSVAEANGKKKSTFGSSSDPVTLHDMGGDSIRRNMHQDDDEDVALAKALSMSAAEKLQPVGLTEDELLRQALEASRLDEQRVPTTFDPYAPGGASSKSTRRHNNNSNTMTMMPPHKMEADQDKKKPARSMKRRVLGGSKTMAHKAGVV